VDEEALAGLAAAGHARIPRLEFSDVAHADVSLDDLAAAAPGEKDLVGGIARALVLTGVLGADPADYRHRLAEHIHFLGTCGAGFHNDVARHWSGCLFWVLALELEDVEFVMPHAGVRLPLAPGDLLVFDPTMAHGLCRPASAGLALATAFETGDHRHQMFLTGELPLGDAQWAALGSPWLPVEAHEHRRALDLMVAEFDERSGTIQRPHALRDSMKRSTCHVQVAPVAV
jgi:hypothetical protein